MSEKTSNPEVKKFPDAETFKIYEDGKHRRYALLFSINGGAFAVAQLVSKTPPDPLGSLTLRQLSIGMILFTALMVFDIFRFGMNMRKYIDVFRLEGQAVLLLIGLLIGSGWALVAL